jgi:hypothetical protein
LNAAKKIILLLWWLVVASFTTASALTPGAAETRVGQKSFAPLESRQAEPLQPLDLRQANASCGYELAPESLLAAKTPITNPSRLLPERAGPTAHISPNEVIGRTPAQIGARAQQLGLQPRGPDPAMGRGAYIDPQTGVQRILSHPNATPPHGHVNNPAGLRIGPDGSVVPPNSPGAHLPINYP